MTDPESLPYRPCAGMMVVNREDRVFVGRRIDQKLEAWQLPQGGIDDGEEPLAAAIRELREETGIAASAVELLAQASGEFTYDLPPDLIGKAWGGRFRGQRMRWFLFRFLGQDSDIDIATDHQEFSAWRWASAGELIDLAVPFKRAIYRNVLDDFAAQGWSLPG